MKTQNGNEGVAGLVTGILKTVLVLIAAVAFAAPIYSQDDGDAVPGKVMDAANRPVGKAALILDTGQPPTNFGYRVYIYLGSDGLMIIKPQSGSRSSSITCSMRDYKIDPAKPKDSSKWTETGSGTATLEMPPSGDVSKINVSVTQTKKVFGDDEVAVTEKAQKLVIVLD